MKPAPPPAAAPGQRLDKWLWAARFYKTRALAAEAVERHAVQVNGQPAKGARQLRVGDRVDLVDAGGLPRCVEVRGLSELRGSAPVAQQLYEETAESLARRAALAEQRRLAPEPAHSLAQGRPTKRDRRQLSDWDKRWSASID
jgi:ribosome-associated heat shock protein Hsp15